ncbi:toxin-antitoxin system HicB family antitoxin [Leucobacter insecticola]|uniref:Toxin-antitoxin system HicB family antitoxin n=1 Tax=Leucobacter insecticola TaxID=2714934 RepID=A0A6G8FJ38_9MICO|nr:toxin-antitoxin system HicB family antitoxin [Leucobacter insecticola]QIM16470.1 toxin-antitoxin system HicB family antitoxin [Leucobacter insecticola]
MQLEQYLRSIQQQLAITAEAGGEEAQQLAERLLLPLESSLRLALLEALSDAASEITLDLSPGSVEVRLRGSDPEFVVSLPNTAGDPEPADTASPTSTASPAPTDSDDTATSRTTLRLPDHLKTQVDQAAARQGVSVNTWLVQAVAAAIHAPHGANDERRSTYSHKSFKGWAQ